MPDISMCLNEECASRSTCYRFTAMPTRCYQSYMTFQPEEGKDKCDEYMPISVTKGGSDAKNI